MKRISLVPDPEILRIDIMAAKVVLKTNSGKVFQELCDISHSDLETKKQKVKGNYSA